MRFQSSLERLVLIVIHVQFFKLRCWESFTGRWRLPDTAQAGSPALMVFRKVRRFIMEIKICDHLRRSAAKILDIHDIARVDSRSTNSDGSFRWTAANSRFSALALMPSMA